MLLFCNFLRLPSQDGTRLINQALGASRERFHSRISRRPASRQRAMATTAQLSPAARGTAAGVLRLGKPRRCATAPDLARSRASPRGSSARAALFGRGAASSGGRPDGLVPFPKDYDQMIAQCQKALQAALDDGVPLMELQFPPAGSTPSPETWRATWRTT